MHLVFLFHSKGGSIGTPATPGDISFKPCVLNCCPPESDYSDMELPEFLAPCVFPCDLKLSSIDCPPYTFTFVLTNASGTSSKFFFASVSIILFSEENIV
jgi:uDENN domain